MYKKVVGQKKVRTGQALPKETADLLKSLPLQERKVYSQLLVKEGWTLQSIANVLGISRQAVDYYRTKGQLTDEAIANAMKLPIPSIPTKDITKMKAKEVDSDVLLQLKELHNKAKLIRGKSKKYRDEAEQFTKLAWEQHQQGISVYSIAKSLGITTGALQFRFVRYGYKTSQGKSQAYNKIQYRKEG